MAEAEAALAGFNSRSASVDAFAAYCAQRHERLEQCLAFHGELGHRHRRWKTCINEPRHQSREQEGGLGGGAQFGFGLRADLIALEVEIFQGRVDLERFGKRFGTLIVDVVQVQVEVGQYRVDLQRIGERCSAGVANLVPAEVQIFQDRVDPKGLCKC